MSDLGSFYQSYRASRLIEPIVLEQPVSIEDLHTPSLVIDLDIFESNLEKMQAFLNAQKISLRAHTKMHKCPEIARRQIAAGATGVCAAKISEAEIMCEAGIADVLVTSPVVSTEKIKRFIDTRSRFPGLKIVVDNIEAATHLETAAAVENIKVGVFVDIDPGMGRTGIEAGPMSVELVRYISQSESLEFCGLQMYAGNCMHIEGFDNRKAKYSKVMQKGIDTIALLQAEGIAVPVVSGGGTGTYNIEPDLGFINELQAGSYAFMDIEYRDIGGEESDIFGDFPVSLFVLVTVISKPQERLVTVDAGFKSLASDKMAPEFRDVEGVTYHWGGDEHGIIQLSNPSREIALGDKLALLTPHCDPTVNLHDFYFPYRDGMVREIWPISARGFSQ